MFTTNLGEDFTFSDVLKSPTSHSLQLVFPHGQNSTSKNKMWFSFRVRSTHTLERTPRRQTSFLTPALLIFCGTTCPKWMEHDVEHGLYVLWEEFLQVIQFFFIGPRFHSKVRGFVPSTVAIDSPSSRYFSPCLQRQDVSLQRLPADAAVKDVATWLTKQRLRPHPRT